MSQYEPALLQFATQRRLVRAVSLETSLKGPREMLPEIYPPVVPRHREKLKEIDRVLLDGLGCFLPDGPDPIAVDGQPTKPSWSQNTQSRSTRTSE
jgi:hypothetical protein